MKSPQHTYVHAYVHTLVPPPHRPWGGRIVSHQKATWEPYEQLQVQAPEALDIIISIRVGGGPRPPPTLTLIRMSRASGACTWSCSQGSQVAF